MPAGSMWLLPNDDLVAGEESDVPPLIGQSESSLSVP